MYGTAVRIEGWPRRSQLLVGGWKNTYLLAGSEFTSVGPAILIIRARQRFFFM